MSIGLTSQELSWCISAVDDTGSITGNIDTYTQSLVALGVSQNDSSFQEGINKKFYDYWTVISSSAEVERAYGRGMYCAAPVTEADITNSANAIECQLFPFVAEAWYNLYPKRVASLYGPSSYDSASEYGRLVFEESNQGSDSTSRDNRHDALYAQKAKLEAYIPYITQLISDASAEAAKYSFLSTIITDASTSKTNADAALVSVNAAIADSDHKSPERLAYISTRKAQLVARESQCSSTFTSVYNYRYQFLDLRVNMQYGTLGNYFGSGKSITIMNNALNASEAQKVTIEGYVS